MGRGRAKAKQTKVARQLKYNSGRTDLSRLAEELGASTPDHQPPNGERFEDDDDQDDDLYARYAEMYSDEEEDDGDEPASDTSSKRRGA
ncbi:DUF3073 domain-containing protein [Streptomyces radicis]|uniref:DUF3073 domain-containing protein n=1 Tax=Streptomyces radicis TaxID=1750517 RepID=A0A3A9WUP3_9ACTN|nr:DUF3073 domain-containing protein [Streptomyces radicis]RKN11526.1 DUF3073 domain-containing protein [Streptomyces radicis]RKN26819.1 DUF3073 domain-containing protein [Streptomyces radicis]